MSGRTPEEDARIARALRCVERVVAKFARRFAGMLDMDEVASEAHLAVVEVARRYDPARDSTYDGNVRAWARGFILKRVTCRTVEQQVDRAAFRAAEPVRAAFRAGAALSAGDRAAARDALRGHAEDIALATFVVGMEARRRAAAAEHPDARYEAAECAALLGEAMKELPHDERVIIEGMFHDEMLRKELPAVLNVSEGTIARRFERALRRLKKALMRLGMMEAPDLRGAPVSKPVLKGIEGGRGGGRGGGGSGRGGGKR